MTVNLLTEHHLEILSLKGGCRGSSKSTFVKMSNCWKSNAVAQMVYTLNGVAHGILVHIAYANSEGLSGPVNIHRLVRAFVARVHKVWM